MQTEEQEISLKEEISTSDRQIAKDADLEKIVLLPTWREVLMDMVRQKEIDPWDVDVVIVSNKYLERIQKMQQVDDLRIPANLILAAAILLRFKSDMLELDEPVVQSTLEDYADEDISYDEIPVLELRGRIPPKRRVTLDELVNAVEKVFERQRVKQSNRKQIPAEIPTTQIEVALSEFDIDSEIENLHTKIFEKKDVENLVRFSNLLKEKNREEVVFTLLPLLFLAQRGDVSINQDPFFGEIFIRVHKRDREDSG